jgi:TonB family protein
MPTKTLSRPRFIVVFGLLLLLLPGVASAQGLLFFSGNGSSLAIPGVPFQGKLVGHYMKDQRDGTRVPADISGSIARDSMGRVRLSEQANQPTIDEILDPVTGTEFVWNGGSTVVMHATNLRRPPWYVTLPASTIEAVREASSEERRPDTVTREDLGKKTIEGLTTTGTRITIQEPNGNLVHEMWVADNLKIAVVDTFTEPQGGPQTIEIQDIHSGDPDPTLFAPPPGLTVQENGRPEGVFGGTSYSPLPRPPDAPAEPRIKVSSEVAAAKLVSQTKPVAPDLAQRAHITGDVVLHVIIAQDGTIESLQVVSGHPLLVQAAVDAVRQWRYTPTLLNGMPVAVDTTITIPFGAGGTP